MTSSSDSAINDQQRDAAVSDAFFGALAERSKTEPLIGAQLGAKELTQRLIAAMKTERGVHIESLVAVLGALAGYACQASVRARNAAQGLPETASLHTVQTSNGDAFLFGDALNAPLAESPYSVWGIAAAGAEQAGCTRLPDMADIFQHVAASVGSDSFGKFRGAGNPPGDLPINYLDMWPGVHGIIVRFCPNPEQWPVLLGIALSDVINMGKSVLDPGAALALAMDAAVAMSKVDRGGK